MNPASPYRGRLAPSPTGYLHLGHARTFWRAQERARARGGTLILRNEDLDAVRFKLEFVGAMLEDLHWFGFAWSEGPDVGGEYGPYNQSERLGIYRAALEKLRAGNFVYPCTCSRKDIQTAVTAPHAADDEVIYPGTCRPECDPWPVASDARLEWTGMSAQLNSSSQVEVEQARSHQEPRSSRREEAPSPSAESSQSLLTSAATMQGTKTRILRATSARHSPRPASWRFRVPDGEVISFTDGNFGRQNFVAGGDFGDFVVWRGDDVPAYQLACVVDDAAMRITEVVRGADLLVSTARQLLLYRALELAAPDFCHCELLRDQAGQRLAKRHDALSLRQLRAQGAAPADLRASWAYPQAQA
jgi:glutamyl-tRNA synthetase